MKAMLKKLDYVFYRSYNVYVKRKDSTPIFMGCLVLVLLLCFSLLCLFSITTVIFRYEINIPKIILLGGIITFLILFWKRYSNGYYITLMEIYKDEDLILKRKRGWWIVMYLILVLSIPICIGYMRHNLGWNI